MSARETLEKRLPLIEESARCEEASPESRQEWTDFAEAIREVLKDRERVGRSLMIHRRDREQLKGRVKVLEEKNERLKAGDAERIKMLDFLEKERHHALGRASTAEARIKELESTIRRLQAQLHDMTQDRDAWEHETETFSHAWRRELENKLIPKTHLIDALVLTTRSLVKSERSLRVELAEKEREQPICMVAECKEHAFETSHFCSRHRVEVGPPTA